MKKQLVTTILVIVITLTFSLSAIAGEYNKQYSLNWLNFNLTEKTIDAEYSIYTILDTGEILQEKKRVHRGPDQFDQYYSKSVNYQGQEARLGDLLLLDTENEIKKENPKFEILQKNQE